MNVVEMLGSSSGCRVPKISKLVDFSRSYSNKKLSWCWQTRV